MNATVEFVGEEPLFYPRCDNVDFSGSHCPNCGHEMFSAECSDCGGDGYFDGYEEDPLWYDNGDLIPCDQCRGYGFELWCPRCHWDAHLPKKYNTPEHRCMALQNGRTSHA